MHSRAMTASSLRAASDTQVSCGILTLWPNLLHTFGFDRARRVHKSGVSTEPDPRPIPPTRQRRVLPVEIFGVASLVAAAVDGRKLHDGSERRHDAGQGIHRGKMTRRRNLRARSLL